jgi:glycosyltransferase involved in cell wall biosynthesis
LDIDDNSTLMNEAASRPDRLRVLILTKVFPNALQPLAAAFNRQQFAALARMADVQVVAPIQWFPGATRLGNRTEAGRLASLPASETVDGLLVHHPRVFHLPRLDYSFAPGLYVASLLPLLRRLRSHFDVVLGSFIYPDALAATWMARLLRAPAVMMALGSDVNVLTSIPGVRTMLRWTFPRASRVVTVSRDLAAKVTELGCPADRVVMVPNGVDRSLFQPRDRAGARQGLGQPDGGKWIVYVGRLEPAKGIDELLAAFSRLPDPSLKLALVGDGSLRARCQQAAAADARILVPGGRPLGEVGRWMAAADVVTLPSWREGTPNVILEALASGRPVVATRVGGIPDVVERPGMDALLGELVPPRDAAALTSALARVLGRDHDPGAIAAAGPISWDESARQLHAVLETAVREPPP